MLQAGTRLGPYEIVAFIGAGGMGAVYRARDPRLGRDVAIKILPADFSADADRLHRFEQEARAAAALNHPNILAVYDIGCEGDAPYIVSELLEGETLRDRLAAGPLPARKAIEHATQIANGLAVAHEKGIVHRDLKPDNVFVCRDQRIKILDFGLAKLIPHRPARETSTALVGMPSPTVPGTVLGTVGYMAPEQVRGLDVDHRADLFAFGAILYELLSGVRAFHRDTAPETMAAILNDEAPDLRSARQPIPPALSRIVERCLEKQPSARFQTASDLAFALSGALDASNAQDAMRVPERRARGRGWLGWVAAAAILAILAPLTYQHLRERPAARELVRFQIPPIAALGAAANFSVSPDGRRLAFVGLGPDGTSRIWIRALDSLEVRPLPGSEASGITPPPFWSPDGRFVVYDIGGALKKLDTAGGLPQILTDLSDLSVGGSWNRQGDIIVGSLAGGLLRLRETGGPASPLTVIDRARGEEFHLLPTFLPDGRHFVYLRLAPGAPQHSGVYVGTLDAAPDAQSTVPLMPYAVGITYAPSGDSGLGRLLFLRDGTLMAQPFDAERLSIAGDSVPVAERVGSFRDGGFFSASSTGVLVYRTSDTLSQVTWFDRQGNMAGRASEPAGFRDVALSPDGTRAVVSRTDPQDATKADLWLLDLSRGAGATRLTFGTGLAEFPAWSEDGQRVVFTLDKHRLRQRLANGEGAEEDVLQTVSAGIVQGLGWTRDGRFLLYATAYDLRTTRWDLLLHERGNPNPVPFIHSPFDEIYGRFSPDGRWVAYVSNQSNVNEVYVRAFATDSGGSSGGTGGATLVSRGGGSAPRWRRDGRELFYLAPNGRLMAADVRSDPTFNAGTPTVLFQLPPGAIVGDVTADGKRFLVITPVGPSASAPFTVELNWTAALKP